MTLKDVLPTLMGSDRLIIKSTTGKMLYHGFRGLLQPEFSYELIKGNHPITRITYFSDLSAKDYKSKGYIAPIDPETATDYEYKNLIQRIYLEITLEVNE